ncbi:MAG: acetyltransferase [Thiocapsa sp.]|uniref:acetyltransferase n=1 Tax=Thiocapsa sp. TaxID=2024551 RepID=UPI001BCFD29A|nr:acetyltransferase [Thiocapsa sp.]QVL50122.1 MAG: acetyltransferase [Thiocapsa sp.]
MKNLILVGAGGLGRELLQWAKDINAQSPRWHIKGFLADDPKALEGIACSHDVLGGVWDWQPESNEVFTCAIGDPADKARVVASLVSRGARLVCVVHPTAIIGEHNQVGAGLIMYPGARITANVRIGDYVTLLSSAIGHDAEVGDFTTVSSHCTITGGVRLGRRVFVGSQATIIPDVQVGDDAHIGAGSVVVSNVAAGMRVMGNPARRFTPAG